jgi:hypothetical protein
MQAFRCVILHYVLIKTFNVPDVLKFMFLYSMTCFGIIIPSSGQPLHIMPTRGQNRIKMY